MKKTTLLVIPVVAMSVLFACKSKKAATATPSTEPSEAQLQAVKTKMPETTMADLKTGHDIFYNQCTACHKAKNVTGYPEDRLHNVVDKMSGKAKLSDTEKAAVWKYALAVNLAAKGS
jgi:cytochrome c2